MGRLKYPIGVQNFEGLRNDNYVYIDKTRYIYELVNSGKYYFLSRPRRFGKSLLLSTIEAFFQGKKELFDGLEIAGLENDWKCHPIFHLDLTNVKPTSIVELENVLDSCISRWEGMYGRVEYERTLSDRFGGVIRRACEMSGERAVILVDEYDAPVMDVLDDTDLHNEMKELLKSVYVNLKSSDAYIRFGMLTGVSRFSRMSIFSGLNNLNDITLDKRYSAICGISEEELRINLTEGVERFAKESDISYEEAMSMLKANYDGYHFSMKSPDIYNPFSLFMALEKGETGAYWFLTGSPSFLIKAIRKGNLYLPSLFDSEADEFTLYASDSYTGDPVALLFQAGYLTIKSYDQEYKTYRLGIPNREVTEGLFKNLLDIYTESEIGNNLSALKSIEAAARNGNPDELMSQLRAFLACIPYDLSHNKPEIYFENNLYIIFRLIGLTAHTEWRTSSGRIDILLETRKYVYVIELKLDSSPQRALNQIEDRNYTLPFANGTRKVFKIGVNFSSATRNIESWETSV